jgi:1-aminocyclopropane-1-carboxylate deaminase/D-cysteine desulfhydrase-like pyridoxal-dependent ACC family enzyme
MQKIALNLPSPVERIFFRERAFFLKRDDHIHSDFSGNKARKFHYFLDHDFPGITRVVSSGSSQSNAMYSLSVLARMRGWTLEYYVDHVAAYLREHSHGNYAGTLSNGALIREGKPPKNLPDDVLIIEEGGRQAEAEYGVRMLAQEILDWQEQQAIEALNVFLPSGTGTTALFLSKAFAKRVGIGRSRHAVYTTPCVGDSEYLRKQFAMLETDERYWPTILEPPHKYHFGKLYKENYEIWIELQQQTGIEFDLLYDPIGWQTLLSHPVLFDAPLMYLHQGGLKGNESMIRRYERKYHDQNI